MKFDWISWGTWSLAVLVFIVWVIQTTREFIEIFREKK
jgi:hypothetical protein